MEPNGDGDRPRWFLVVRADQRELLEVLQERLEGSGVEVLLDRRTRERRRGSLGPAMDRRSTERRRQRALATLSLAPGPEAARPAAAPEPAHRGTNRTRNGAVTHRCPTCAEQVELELPRFPHPPARVETEVGHATGNGQHYAEIAAFTVSGRLILSQRVPARRRS